MFQVWFLLVLFNIMSGLVLAHPFLAAYLKRSHTSDGCHCGQHRKGARIALALITIFVAILAFVLPFSPEAAHGHGVYVLGDLLPALSGVLAGISLLVPHLTKDALNESDTAEDEEADLEEDSDELEDEDSDLANKGKKRLDQLSDYAKRYGIPIGFLAIALGLMHFFAPAILFF